MTDRERFEAWYESRANDLRHDVLVDWRLRDANGHYLDRAAWDHWYIWQSAIKQERAKVYTAPAAPIPSPYCVVNQAPNAEQPLVPSSPTIILQIGPEGYSKESQK